MPLVAIEDTAGVELNDETLPAEIAGEVPAVSEVELPLSCTPSARAVKSDPPTRPPEGFVGLVMFDVLKLTFAALPHRPAS